MTNFKLLWLLFWLFPALTLAASMPPPPAKNITLPFENQQINYDCYFCSDSHDGLRFQYDLQASKKIVCEFKGLVSASFWFVDNGKPAAPGNYRSNKVTFTNKGKDTSTEYHVDAVGSIEIRANDKSYASCHYENEA